MLKTNPLTSGAGTQVLDWQTRSHSSTYNPVTDVTTQTWRLRNDLRWHDGFPVTATDVCYTIIAYRDVPSIPFLPRVSNVLTCTVLSSSTLNVALSGTNPSYELDIGLLPLLPKSVWGPLCGDPPTPAGVCDDPGFDPMAGGFYIGDGPWVCRNLFTQAVGGPCAFLGPGLLGQAVPPGGQFFLASYGLGFVRCCPNVDGSSLQAISWADKNDDGSVNILDIADAALYYGIDHGYWDHPIFGVTDGIVDIGEISTIAFYFDHGITKPFTPTALTSIDPKIDPFLIVDPSSAYYTGSCPASANWSPVPAGGACLYWGGLSIIGGAPIVILQILPPVPLPPPPAPPPERARIEQELKDGSFAVLQDVAATISEERAFPPSHQNSDKIFAFTLGALPPGHYRITVYKDGNGNGAPDPGEVEKSEEKETSSQFQHNPPGQHQSLPLAPVTPSSPPARSQTGSPVSLTSYAVIATAATISLFGLVFSRRPFPRKGSPKAT